MTFKVEMSYLEIYNETIRDLLSTNETPLGVRDVYVGGGGKREREREREKEKMRKEKRRK